MPTNPLLSTKVGADSATESLLQTGRDLVSAFKVWKETGCPVTGTGLRLIETLSNRVAHQCRELERSDTDGLSRPPRSEQHRDELIPFVLKLITETQPGDPTKGGLMVVMPNSQKDWLPKSKIAYDIKGEPERAADGKLKAHGTVEVQVPRWLAQDRGMI